MKRLIQITLVCLLVLGVSIVYLFKTHSQMGTAKADGTSATPVTVDWVNQQVKTRTDQLDQMSQKLDQISSSLDSIAKPPIAFKDVNSGYFAYKQINYLSSRGIINGYPTEQKFYPGRSVTRYQAAVMVLKAKGIALKDGTSTFDDISNTAKDQNVREVALTALKNGVIHGVPQKDGTFKLKFEPNAVLTRQQMASFISNSFTFSGQTSYSYPGFSDVSTANSHYDSIKTLAIYHIVQGKGSGLFDPGAATTRAQFCIFLSNALNPSFRN